MYLEAPLINVEEQTMNINKWIWTMAMVGVVSWNSAQAMDIRPVILLGADFGGDTIINVPFTDGSSESVKANEGLLLGGGASILNESKTLELQVTLAYKLNMVIASNGDITWGRIPIELLAFYRAPRVRIGGGLTYHLSPELSGTGEASGLDVKFDNALGFVLEGDYLFAGEGSWSGAFLGLRFTSLKYKEKNFGTSFNSNGIGAQIGYRF
jgi:hypothetical protein